MHINDRIQTTSESARASTAARSRITCNRAAGAQTKRGGQGLRKRISLHPVTGWEGFSEYFLREEQRLRGALLVSLTVPLKATEDQRRVEHSSEEHR
jgi:hypothetical protein